MTRRTLISLAAGAFVMRAEAPELSIERRVFDAINFQRVAKDREPLDWDGALAEVARRHSERMAALSFFAHEDPEFGDVGARLTAAGIAWAHCGENIFRERGWEDPVAIAVVEWMYSTGHRANLLNPEFTRSGVGRATDAEGRILITQNFMRPAQGE